MRPGQSLDVVWIARFGAYVFVFLLCGHLLEDAGKRDYCGLNGCVADICAVYAHAVGNMDVKSVGALNYLLFHLRLRFPTFRPPLHLKFFEGFWDGILCHLRGWVAQVMQRRGNGVS